MRGRFFVTFFALGLVLTIFHLAKAQKPFWNVSFNDISKVEANITLDEQGNAFVEKNFYFISPVTNFSWTEDLGASDFEIFGGDDLIDKQNYKIEKTEDRYTISAENQTPSLKWQVNYRFNNAADFDEIKLPVILEPGININRLSILVHLPKPIDQTKVTQRIYAIHGVGKNNFSIKDSQTLYYSGDFLAPTAIYSISAEVPKEVFSFSFSKKISLFVRSSIANIWLIIAIILPLIAFSFYFYMLQKRKKEENVSAAGYLDAPPDDLPPAVVGVLLRQKVSQREIVATIIDLTQRGFIEIVKKPTEYVLGKRQGEGKLATFEAFLYDKLFTQQNERKIKRSEEELENRAREQLYSQKITQFCESIYQEAQRRNLFIKSPAFVILRYRLWGMGFFILTVVFAILSAKFSEGPPYAIFGALGGSAAAFLIMKTAPLMPKRTKKGTNELSSWLAFSKYLIDQKPIRAAAIGDRIYEKNLPYAVALGKEIDWTKRFSQTVYLPPSWYVTDEQVTIENFAGSLFYIAGDISRSLYELREPSL